MALVDNVEISNFETEAVAVEKLNKTPWTPSEDAGIIKLVQKYGANWVSVSQHMVGRTGKQCRERYYNHLQENIKKGDWSADEDQRILRLQAKLGNQWVRIMRELPGRTDNAIKNRFHALERAHTKLIPFVESAGEAKNIGVDATNIYKKIYSDHGKRSDRHSDPAPEWPPVPSTPTSVANITTPNAIGARDFRSFAWKPTTATVPEAVVEEADTCVLGVDAVAAMDLCDCLSPLMVKHTQKTDIFDNQIAAPVEEVYGCLFDGVEDKEQLDIEEEEVSADTISDEEEEARELRLRTHTPLISSLSGTPISSAGESVAEAELEEEPASLDDYGHTISAAEKVGLLARLESAMYADILELDLLSSSESEDESTGCCSSVTDCESLSDCLSVDVDFGADEDAGGTVRVENYPIMLKSPLDAFPPFAENGSPASGLGTVAPSAPCSANPSPVHKRTRYSIWA